MASCLDPRYRIGRTLGQQDGRLICSGLDLLTDQPVVLKTAPIAAILHELAVMLTLPPGIGPRVLDVVWTGDRRLILVLEELKGSTLLTAKPRPPVESVPDLAHAICQKLAHLHRLGIVHVDLKPANIFLLAGEAPGQQVRIIDYGLAQLASGVRNTDDESFGGTLTYAAPEVQRGWAFDGRADLFSLGMTLNDAFPRLESDPRWPPILERLCDPLPSRRFADALSLRNEIERSFGLRPRDDRIPRFGGGPMLGRQRELAELLDLALGSVPAAHILLSARRGTGLTRFLLEGLMVIARSRGPAARSLDLSAMHPTRWSRALAFLRERSSSGESVLCGVADPSPGLRWLDVETGATLRELFRPGARQRIALRPLDVDAFSEATARVLDARGAAAERVGAEIWRRTEGNLRDAADGLANVMSDLDCDGEWSSSSETRLDRALSSWTPPAPEPSFDTVPVDLRPALKVSARAGGSFPRPLAERLMATFLDPEALVALVDHGYLQDEGGDRLAFVTRRLRRAALEEPLANDSEIRSWLNRNATPDPLRPDEVLEACARAWSVADPGRAAEMLGRALETAYDDRRWRDVRQFLECAEAPAVWDGEILDRRIRELVPLLQGRISPARLTLIAAAAFLEFEPSLSLTLFESLAAGSSPEAAPALVSLLEWDIAHGLDEAFERHLRALRALETTTGAPLPGEVDRLLAWRAQSLHHIPEAIAHAERALRKLQGTGTRQEVLARQLIAAIGFRDRPAEGIAQMSRALELPHDPEMHAQIAHNLALMQSAVGDPGTAIQTAERGIRALESRRASIRLLRLRARRAWSLAGMDRTEEALREARDLLERVPIRWDPPQRVQLRLLAGFCHLHQGASRAAITETARALEESRDGGSLALQFDALLYMIDTLLDLEAWDRVRGEGSSLYAADPPSTRRDRMIAARLTALRARAAGDSEAAVAALAGLAAEVRRETTQTEVARFLYHYGAARLAEAADARDCEGAAEAVGLLDEAIERLPGPAFGYHRGRAMLVRAAALAAAGEPEGGRRLAEETCDLARRLGCRGLLADALRVRVRLDLELNGESLG